jgi:hypothetical protein
MEKQQVVFFRNLLLRIFVVGVVFGLLYLTVTISFWDTWVSVFARWKIDEKEAALVMVSSLTFLRIILVFLILVPAIALHWTSKAS